MSAFPPHRSIASIPVPQDTALKYLQAYLEAAKNSPHLLPNARLEPSGPTAGSSDASVTIHNLQRVEAGLRGEWLAPKLDLDEGVEIVQGMDDGTNKQGEKNKEGWMDLDQYQREQSVEGPEQAQEEIGVEEDDDMEYGDVEQTEEQVLDAKAVAAPTMKSAKRLHTEIDGKASGAAIDKVARKKEKKERQKAEQKLKAQKAAAKK